MLFKIFKLSDTVIFLISFVVTSSIISNKVTQIAFYDFMIMRVRIINLLGFVALIILWHNIFLIFNLYRSRRLRSSVDEWKDIFKATSLGTALFYVVGYVFHIRAFTPTYLVFFWLTNTILTILFRNILRFILAKMRFSGKNLHYILIAGANDNAYDFSQKIEEKKEMGYRVIGFIDKTSVSPNGDLKFLGTIESLPKILRDNIVDEIIITLPVKSCFREIKTIVKLAEEQGILVRHLHQFFETKIVRSKLETFEGFVLLTMNSGQEWDGRFLIKRLVDVIISTAVIIATLPLMVLVALLIKLTSPGPVFYVQRRVGYNKRIINVLKFRTMVAGAEDLQYEYEALNEMDGPVFKIKNDPRVTKIGKWLRNTSIDELPQLFNVLKGDLSLVGPRPLPIRDYNGFHEDWQRRRFSVKPGITCLWQVNGRNDLSFEEWMKMDMEYIDNWNLSNDFKILFKTIPAVLRGKGAS